MIQTPHRPLYRTREPPPPAAGFQRRSRVLKGGLPVEVTPRETPSAASKPRIWLPALLAAHKQAWLELQDAVAEVWTRELRNCLEDGAQVTLRGVSFETLEQLEADCACGGVMDVFTSGERMAGCALISAGLMRALAGNRIGCEAESDAAALTRLEAIMAGRGVERMVRQLNDCYRRAGIGAIKSIGRSEGLKGSPWFGADDCLMVFRYSAGDPGRNRTITIAINEELTRALKPAPASKPRTGPSAQLRRAAAAAPLAAAIVLGGWRVSLAELAGLAPGDELVLPPGDNARLEVAGCRVRRLRVHLTGSGRINAQVGSR